MRLSELIKQLNRYVRGGDDQEIMIPVTDHGSLGPTSAVPVTSAMGGIDWDKGRIFLRPEQSLSRLSEEDVQAIHQSLRSAQSWHGYQAHKAMIAEVRAAQEKARAAEERACAAEQAVASGPVHDLVAHLHRQRAFSERTFGPGARTRGVLDHIAKELAEIAEHPGDLEEWIDVVLLAFDGAWRSGHAPEQIAAALTAKQAKNEGRTWPDWRTAPADQAIEHERGA